MAYSADESLRSVILSSAAVTALVGSRVFPLKLPDKPTLPAIVYQRNATSQRQYSTTGDSHLYKAHFLVSCWGTSHDSARALGEAVIDMLSGYAGTYSSSIQVVEDVDDEEPDTGRYRTLLGINLWSK
jgi:hypothetical protein